jgi:hypothetical protein
MPSTRDARPSSRKMMIRDEIATRNRFPVDTE